MPVCCRAQLLLGVRLAGRPHAAGDVVAAPTDVHLGGQIVRGIRVCDLRAGLEDVFLWGLDILPVWVDASLLIQLKLFL